jgi:hypothetical protein
MENQVNDQQYKELDEATKGLEPQDGSVEEKNLRTYEKLNSWSHKYPR